MAKFKALMGSAVKGLNLQMQDCKSLCAVVTICATLVNIQTHRCRTHTQTAFWSAYMRSSASWADNCWKFFNKISHLWDIVHCLMTHPVSSISHLEIRSRSEAVCTTLASLAAKCVRTPSTFPAAATNIAPWCCWQLGLWSKCSALA